MNRHLFKWYTGPLKGVSVKILRHPLQLVWRISGKQSTFFVKGIG